MFIFLFSMSLLEGLDGEATSERIRSQFWAILSVNWMVGSLLAVPVWPRQQADFLLDAGCACCSRIHPAPAKLTRKYMCSLADTPNVQFPLCSSQVRPPKSQSCWGRSLSQSVPDTEYPLAPVSVYYGLAFFRSRLKRRLRSLKRSEGTKRRALPEGKVDVANSIEFAGRLSGPLISHTCKRLNRSQ